MSRSGTICYTGNVMAKRSLSTNHHYAADDELMAALDAFRRAAYDLTEVWERNGDDRRLEGEEYPFKNSFDEVASDISDWYHAARTEPRPAGPRRR